MNSDFSGMKKYFLSNVISTIETRRTDICDAKPITSEQQVNCKQEKRKISAPHVSAPHVSAPHVSAPHVSAPHVPIATDSLFWCFYRIAFGEIAYDMAQSHASKTRMDTLINLSQKVLSEKALLRANKLSAQEVSASLSSLKFTTSDFAGACLSSNISATLIMGNRYLILGDACDGEHHVVMFDSKVNSWVTEQMNDQTMRKKLLTNKLSVLSIDKPLNAVSSYTKDDLEKIVAELGIYITNQGSKKTTKKMMYEAIVTYALQ